MTGPWLPQHRSWCVPEDCLIIPRTVEATHVGPEETMILEGAGRVDARVFEVYPDGPPPGVLLAVSARQADAAGRIVEVTTSVELRPHEAIDAARTLLRLARDAAIFGGER
ncbi:MAG: hypothetical protein GEV09_12690 [Pseudonocardiaceae bacterium]|nr:hypothetical protein [Pseudonocardiaceae bacterium]